LATSLLTVPDVFPCSAPQSAASPEPATGDSFPKLVLRRASQHGHRTSIREKEFGIWQAHTWGDAARAMREIACGFAALGMQRGDKVAIIGDNRPQFYWSMLAVQALGAVPVPIYQDAVADEMRFVLDHAETRFAVAENQEQVDKLIAIKDDLPHLETIIYKDARGLRHYGQRYLTSLDAVQRQGRGFDAAHPGFFEREVAQGRGSDISVIAYTSGTTGRPKGVMLSFDNLLAAAQATVAFDRLDDDGQVMAYLPMAWIGDHLFSYAQAIGRVCRQLPGEQRHGDDRSEGDRAELPLRAAACLREHPDAGDDPHGGCRAAEAPHVRQFHGRGATLRRRHFGAAAGPDHRPRTVRPGQPADLRPVAQHAWPEPGAHRLYGRRGDRAGYLPVLPLTRHQSEAALWPDRIERLWLPADR
jgi:hypothetical protein